MCHGMPGKAPLANSGQYAMPWGRPIGHPRNPLSLAGLTGAVANGNTGCTPRKSSVSVEQVSREAGAAAAAAKGTYGCGIGEEWMAGLPVAWGLREFIEALEAGGRPRPAGVTERADGQLVVDAFPLGWAPRAHSVCKGTTLHATTGGGLQNRSVMVGMGSLAPAVSLSARCPAAWPRIGGRVADRECSWCRVESLFFGGMRGEVWVQPGMPASQVPSAFPPCLPHACMDRPHVPSHAPLLISAGVQELPSWGMPWSKLPWA